MRARGSLSSRVVKKCQLRTDVETDARKDGPEKIWKNCWKNCYERELAAPQGFDPRYADPESAVLPLNEGAASGARTHAANWHFDPKQDAEGQPILILRVLAEGGQSGRPVYPSASVCAIRGRSSGTAQRRATPGRVAWKPRSGGLLLGKCVSFMNPLDQFNLLFIVND
jgi:hypothetical protein